MKTLRSFLCLALTAASFGAVPAAAAPKRVLYFTKSSNFEHSVVKRRGQQPSFSEQVLAEFGPRHDIAFTFSKDGSLFSPEYLAQFDAVMFYTSGDLLSAGKDGNPPLTPAGKAALLEAVASGRLGFVGIHSAADTFHTGETPATNTDQPRTWRYRTLGEHADPYLRMLGGELIVHGTQQIARATVIDPTFPGFAGLGPHIELMEEWYSLTEFSDNMRVLLRLETAAMRDPNANGTDWPPAGWDTPYQRPPFPNTWARRHGRGRVFYTALGHREDAWLSETFEKILFGGLDWVLRRVDADVTPNFATATPGARELPPVSGPVAGLPKALRNLPPPPIPPRP
ncbi:MAG TPA: ThuA domain-containing protein [Opitutus sp.]|nr:ThuA domain-containing protein [Opitutus sp.]